MKKMIWGFWACMLLTLAACGGKQAERDYAAEYADSIFVGDSVTEGFSFNEILKEENVLAGAGATAGFSLENVDTLIGYAPKRVYILLGQCDLLMPVEEPLQLFYNEYKKYIRAIQKKLPDCKIYLQAITDVSEKARREEPRYGEIEVYNDTIRSLAEELSVTFVDLNAFADEHTALFAEDGIHFQKAFYPLWLDFLAEQE